jgi:hypothetical protein
MIHVHMIPITGAKMHCFHTGLGGEDPKGGAHCYAGECAGRETMYSSDSLSQHYYWLAQFDAMGTHECINGVWKESYYMLRWIKPRPKDLLASGGNLDVNFTCCVLGESSYFKLFDAEVSGHFSFEMNDTVDFVRGDVSVSENAQEGLTSIEVVQNTTHGAEAILDFHVTCGSSKCVPFFTMELCVSWLFDGQVEMFFQVNGNKAESLTLMKTSPDLSYGFAERQRAVEESESAALRNSYAILLLALGAFFEA